MMSQIDLIAAFSDCCVPKVLQFPLLPLPRGIG
jgi:hypothetical protein